MASVRKSRAGAIKNDALVLFFFANLADPVSAGGQGGQGPSGRAQERFGVISGTVFLWTDFTIC